MFRQHHHCLVVDQACVAGAVELRRELEVNQCQALIIPWGQIGLDAQQVAAIIIHTLVNRELDAQVRKVVANIPLRGPPGITACSSKEGNQ